jgi:hypothetical protein
MPAAASASCAILQITRLGCDSRIGKVVLTRPRVRAARVVHGDGAAGCDDFALAPWPLKTLGHAGHVAAGDTSGIAFMQTTQVAHAGPE